MHGTDVLALVFPFFFSRAPLVLMAPGKRQPRLLVAAHFERHLGVDHVLLGLAAAETVAHLLHSIEVSAHAGQKDVEAVQHGLPANFRSLGPSLFASVNCFEGTPSLVVVKENHHFGQSPQKMVVYVQILVHICLLSLMT